MKPLKVDSQRALRRFGKAIRDERWLLGLSQETLAELADVHATYVGKVERAEKNISFENILHIAAALELTPSELFARAGL